MIIDIPNFYKKKEITLLSKEISEVPKDFEGISGKWVKVNSNLVPINNLGNEIEDENNILNILKTKKFTWNY